MSIIRVSVDREISVHEVSLNNKMLCELIGNNCDCVEQVLPRRLYSELNHTNDPGSSKGVVMLVDEEGLLKENKMNVLASYLYEVDKHGSPIMGNVLFVGIKYENMGISFCELDKDVEKKLYEQLEVRDMKKIRKPQIKKNEWIPVEKGLPEDSKNFKEFLVCFENGDVCTSLRLGYTFALDNWEYGKIIAWQEMPKPLYWWKKKQRKSKKWISIKEKKAPLNKKALVQYANGRISEDMRRFDGFVLESLYGKVLYWMPLPEPYIPKGN